MACAALGAPAAALAGTGPPADPPGQGTPPQAPPGQAGQGGPEAAPGQVRQEAANPASHHPPAPARPEARQNRGNGDVANGCTGSVKTTVADGSVANANRYALGDPVYLSGSNFPAGALFNFEVMHVQTKAIVASGSFLGAADGAFLQQVAQDPALSGHEYKVIVYYNAASGHRCHKSDNFFFVGGEDAEGRERVIICVATGSARRPYRERRLPAAALENRQRKAGDIAPAPEGGCPVAGEVAAVERATAPRQVLAGRSLTITVRTVPNAVVSIAGAGVRRTAVASSTGVVRVAVRPTRPGIVVVRAAGVRPLTRIGVLGARTSGRPLTG